MVPYGLSSSNRSLRHPAASRRRLISPPPDRVPRIVRSSSDLKPGYRTSRASWDVQRSPTRISEYLIRTVLPYSRTGVQHAGPIPYLVGRTACSSQLDRAKASLASNCNHGFGMPPQANVGPGRIIQLALKLY